MIKGGIHFKDLILYENEDYVVINKPPFIATLEDRVEKVNVLALAKDYTLDAQVCHRLDKETSGVLAIAKNPEAYRHLSMQFEHREVTKIYHAVVDGCHKPFAGIALGDSIDEQAQEPGNKSERSDHQRPTKGRPPMGWRLLVSRRVHLAPRQGDLPPRSAKLRDPFA